MHMWKCITLLKTKKKKKNQKWTLHKHLKNVNINVQGTQILTRLSYTNPKQIEMPLNSIIH